MSLEQWQGRCADVLDEVEFSQLPQEQLVALTLLLESFAAASEPIAGRPELRVVRN